MGDRAPQKKSSLERLDRTTIAVGWGPCVSEDWVILTPRSHKPDAESQHSAN